VVPQHRHERHDARAPADQQQGPSVLDPPGEVAADRSAQLDLVPGAELAGEVRRDLAVVDALDRQREPRVIWRRGDRVGALRLVAVVRRQAHVDVLARLVAGPLGNVEHDRPGRRGLVDDLADVRGTPEDGRSGGDQSPQ
jgi:hypothetical protein